MILKILSDSWAAAIELDESQYLERWVENILSICGKCPLLEPEPLYNILILLQHQQLTSESTLTIELSSQSFSKGKEHLIDNIHEQKLICRLAMLLLYLLNVKFIYDFSSE
ncbi:Uncharacterized protein TCM_016401 [Theobroma cacao]|uniref:Uncharacterized protein n=1 Tax=Theobroma cacao TaxID=3641 RepID=A0A061G6W8_THECC|nr:Uncharacterized protein TCM_016401 [Theobroma cacao]